MTEPMTTARRFTFLRSEDPANCAGDLRFMLSNGQEFALAAPPVNRRCVGEGELIVFGLAHDWMMADGDENINWEMQSAKMRSQKLD